MAIQGLSEQLIEIKNKSNLHDYGDTYQLADAIMNLTNIVGLLLSRIEKLEEKHNDQKGPVKP